MVFGEPRPALDLLLRRHHLTSAAQEYLPTVLLAVAIPYISQFLEDVADMVTNFENHRTQDNHEMSRTQKIFVLNFITNYLPIFLTAFVYVPFGDSVIPYLETLIYSRLRPERTRVRGHIVPGRP